MSTPSMITFIAPKLKEPFLNSLNNCKLFIVPLVRVLLHEKSSECFLWSPLNRNPFQSLRSTRSGDSSIRHWHSWKTLRNNLDWNFTIYIIFNLLYRAVRSTLANKRSANNEFKIVWLTKLGSLEEFKTNWLLQRYTFTSVLNILYTLHAHFPPIN